MAAFSYDVRKGQAPPRLSREEFRRRYLTMFTDPAFDGEWPAVERLEAIAYQAYSGGRKAPITEKAGPEFQDPTYDISSEWLATRARLRKAQEQHADPVAAGRVLVICGSDRND